jgi:minichromosome maintenance protein 10
VYSVARLSRDGSTYDIPVDGDWITIAVVAERGEVRVSGMRDAVSNDEDEEDEDDDNDGQPPGAKAKSAKGKGKDGKDPKKRKRRPKKYLSLKLVALPPRSKSLGSAAASGDAMLTLLLFESDATIRSPDGEVRTYRGGSGGAYERWCNLAVGSVIALLNPRVLRPLKSGAGAPHPLTHPLALNPQSDASIQLIGHATDLGQCVSTLRDGSRCKTWVDTRLNTVCEYHLHAAVVRGRSSRAEFASASTPLGFGGAVGGSGGAGSGSGYDPRTKTGLLPRNGARPAPADGGGATYIVGTGIAHTGLQPPGSAGGAFLSERMGRGQAAKRKRQEAKEAEAALAKILEHGGDNSVGAKYLSSLGVALGKDKDKDPKEGEPERKRVFTAEAIKRIGYDPSGRRNEDPSKRVSGRERVSSNEYLTDQNATIAALMAPSTRPVQLGRPLGPKKLSNVVTPAAPGPKRNKDDLVELD